MKVDVTERGFVRGDFKDRYGEECSIQESSLATEAALWLGINEVHPVYMSHAGWQPIPYPPDDVVDSARMHLTQRHVKTLLPLLNHFAKYGCLPDVDGSEFLTQQTLWLRAMDELRSAKWFVTLAAISFLLAHAYTNIQHAFALLGK